MAILIITHDLGVVANMAEDVVVMYRGKVMESGTQEEIFRSPRHDYLKALLRAVPRFGMKPGERLTPLREIRSETGHLIAEREAWPAAADAAGPLLAVSSVSKTFAIRKSGWFGSGAAHTILAVDDVSFTVERGECLGLVGESGCGKTTLSKILMRALEPNRGKVAFNDRGTLRDVLALAGDDLTRFRQRMQFIFQDPYGSLNPRMTIFDIISEPLVIHEIGDHAYRVEMVQELMKLVGLDPRFLNRYPHSFSGGQRQRIGIARALALRPDLIICDEPVSALDVSIQAQILNLLKDLKAKLGLTYLFISHNLAVVDYIADRIAVMCAGRLVELAPTRELFDRPLHPYTRALLAAVPEPDIDRKLDLTALMEGRASNPIDWPWPFKIEPGAKLELIDVGDSHFVRADPAADIPSIMHATEMVA
jgi:peptide/nickel transport system ATP-binding protein